MNVNLWLTFFLNMEHCDCTLLLSSKFMGRCTAVIHDEKYLDNNKYSVYSFEDDLICKGVRSLKHFLS